MGTLVVKIQNLTERSLLLASRLVALRLGDARDDFAKHDTAVAVHECNTREALAVLEGVAHERLLRLEGALCHLVGLERMRILELLATSLLAHLPLERGDSASSATAAHETDGRVTDFDLVGNVKHLDLSMNS